VVLQLFNLIWGGVAAIYLNMGVELHPFNLTLGGIAAI
jgi:hypothetical protein